MDQERFNSISDRTLVPIVWFFVALGTFAGGLFFIFTAYSIAVDAKSRTDKAETRMDNIENKADEQLKVLHRIDNTVHELQGQLDARFGLTKGKAQGE
jgi:uncharacterized protein YybS (DUF2232 family)